MSMYSRTAGMSSSMRECHRSDAVLICGTICQTNEASFIDAYRVDEANAGKVHAVLRMFVYNFWVMDSFRSNMLVP